jgi:hypothetical protein
MDPVRVLRLARKLGGLPGRTLVVACEPEAVVDPNSEEVVADLSPTVRAAAGAAVPLVRRLVDQLLEERPKGGDR